MSEAETTPARRTPRRFLVVLTLMALVVVFADVLVSAFASDLRQPLYWPTWESQHKYDAINTADTSYRVMFFGDSVLDSAVDPSLMSALSGGAFNASLAGEPLPVVEDWASRIVVPRFHPSTVVLGFDINVLSDPGNDQAGLVQLFERSRPVAVAEGRGDYLDRLDGWLHAHFSLYKYRTVLRQPFRQTTTGGTPIYNPPLSALGWNEGFQAGVQSAAAADFDQEEVGYRIDQRRLALIGEMVRRLRAEGTNVVLVMMPVSAAYIAALPGGQPTYALADAQMTREASAGGATVLQAGEWSKQYFADVAHLNRAGTVRFSTWIARKLAGAA